MTRGGKVQALLCNEMSAGFSDLAGAILSSSSVREHGSSLGGRERLPKSSGGIGQKVIFGLIVH